MNTYSSAIQRVLKGMQDGFRRDSVPFVFLRTNSSANNLTDQTKHMMYQMFCEKVTDDIPNRLKTTPILFINDKGLLEVDSSNIHEMTAEENPFFSSPRHTKGFVHIFTNDSHILTLTSEEFISRGFNAWSEVSPMISLKDTLAGKPNQIVNTLSRQIFDQFNTPFSIIEQGPQGIRYGVGSDFDSGSQFLARTRSGAMRGRLVRVSKELDLVSSFLQNLVEPILLSIFSTPYSAYKLWFHLRTASVREEGKVKVELRLEVSVTLEYSIAISPHILSKDQIQYADTALRSLESSESNRDVGKIPYKFRLQNFEVHKPSLPALNWELQSKAIRTLSRSFSHSIPLGSYTTNFENVRNYKADAREILKEFDSNKIDQLRFGLLNNIRGSIYEVAREYMQTIGSSVLDLYFDDEQKSIMYQNFMTAIELYMNKHFDGTPYSTLNEYSEKLDKRIERCFYSIESLREAYLQTLERGDFVTEVINLSGASPSRIESTFSRRTNHLVVVGESGDLLYYKLELSLGTGTTACHRVVKFPKVFADGYVIGPDKSIYKVSASDLVRGRVLRSSEITLEQALGEINNEQHVTESLDESTPAASGHRAVVQASSDYQECGFDEDIGDEEREFIDMALQNQILALRS